MKWGLVLVSLCFIHSFFSQDRSEIIQQRIEFISELYQSEELDLTNVIDQLNFFFENPINLNTTDGEDLEQLYLLSTVQINNLLLHRKTFGKFISVYELQSLKYWDLNTIQLVLPFVVIDNRLDNLHITFKEAMKQGKFELFLRYIPTVERKKGYDKVSDSIQQTSNNYYYGNADRYFTRFRYTYKSNISVGFTGEKDAGEQFFRGAQKSGFDFYSAHAFFKGGKYLRSAVIGDYQIQIGQGLNLWSSYAFGKTADCSTIKKTANPLKAYTSVDENRFLRGAAVDLSYKDLSLLLFASRKKVDAASIADSSFDDLEFISTIDLSGLHRTNREIAKRNGLIETITGANLRYSIGALRIGSAFVFQGYDKPYIKATQLYNQYDFRGKSNISFSGDFSYVYRNVNLFGEISKNHFNYNNQKQGGLAAVLGALISVDSRATIGIIYRNYSKDYQTFYNAGFSEGSNTQNEKGLFTGIKLKLNSKWSVNGYTDMFQFPWMKYLVDAPSKGHEFLIQPTYKPNKIFEVYGRFRQQLRQRNSRDSDGTVTELEDVMQRNYRLNLSYTVNEFFTLKTRLEYVTIHRKSNTPEKGMLFTQDFIYRPKSLPVDLALRYALFDTDSYDSRIYSFENTALYTFAIPAYYYQGSRAYALIRYSFARHFDLWFKYGVFLYNNRNTISSGAEEIQGSRKSDIVLQLRISL
ncbi:MAG: hypothetical protein EBU01_04720 [Crocinitomicaceae bacterium]|nr:hypothetical protein [Crocinitomicaceae bacterium]